MRSFEVATVGDNCIDRYLPPIGLSTVGGNAVNVAVHLSRLGWATAYFGAVGQDSDGERTRAVLRAEGLQLSGLKELRAVTAWTDLDVDLSGDRVIAFEEFGACRLYRPAPEDLAELAKARHVHIGWLNDSGALERDLIAAGRSVSKDLAVNPGAAGLTVAFGSAGADMDRARAMLEEMLRGGARCCIVTCGALGSLGSDGRETVAVGVAPTEVFDTTGAGDTFIAGFLAAHLRGQSLRSAMEAGRDAAAVTCRTLGGFSQVPVPLT